MELEHAFTVPVGIDEAWAVLRDIERVGPCMPGAAIESVEGEHFTGSVKVKVGPITVQYRGAADFVDVDDQAHRATIDAKGRETKGSGTARATVTAALHPVADGTRVKLVTDLAVTGKPAQFGRSVMADVGSKLVGRFADCLSAELAGPSEPVAPAPVAVPDVAREDVPGPTAEVGDAARGDGARRDGDRAAAHAGERAGGRPSDDAIDLLEVAGTPVARALAPVAGGLALLAVLAWLLRRRST